MSDNFYGLEPSNKRSRYVSTFTPYEAGLPQIFHTNQTTEPYINTKDFFNECAPSNTIAQQSQIIFSKFPNGNDSFNSIDSGCHSSFYSSGTSSPNTSAENQPIPQVIVYQPPNPCVPGNKEDTNRFDDVSGRLCLLSGSTKYPVTVDEVKRRIYGPESLNISLLNGMLRKGKGKDNGKFMRSQLQAFGIAVPCGRRKTAATTGFTALSEREAALLARDFSILLFKEGGAVLLAQQSCGFLILQFPFRHAPENILDAFRHGRELLEFLCGIYREVPDDQVFIPQANIDEIFVHRFCNLTHGFGPKALRGFLNFVVDVNNRSISLCQNYQNNMQFSINRQHVPVNSSFKHHYPLEGNSSENCYGFQQANTYNQYPWPTYDNNQALTTFNNTFPQDTFYDTSSIVGSVPQQQMYSNMSANNRSFSSTSTGYPSSIYSSKTPSPNTTIEHTVPVEGHKGDYSYLIAQPTSFNMPISAVLSENGKVFEKFDDVSGRLCLLSGSTKYPVTVDEVKRRINGPESLNISLLNGMLRKGKAKDNGKLMKSQLQAFGIVLPSGRRKTAPTTGFTALSEKEAVVFAGHFGAILNKEGGSVCIAKKYLAIIRSKHDLEQLLNAAEKYRLVLEYYCRVYNNIPEYPDHVNPTTQEELVINNFSMLTHGFGHNAVRALFSFLYSVNSNIIALGQQYLSQLHQMPLNGGYPTAASQGYPIV